MIDETRKQTMLKTIRALLAKANDAGVTEEESALFAAKAQELLAKYQISEAEIAEKPETIIQQRNKKTQWSLWRRNLLNATCLFYMCKLVNFEDHYRIFGLECNIEVSKSMFQYLVKAIDRLSKEYAESSMYLHEGVPVGRVREDFRRGCSVRVCERLREMRKAQMQQAQQWNGNNPGNLPALMNQQVMLVRHFIASVGITLEKGEKTNMKFGDAAGEGYKRGDEVSLNTQVSGSKSHGRLMIGSK